MTTFNDFCYNFCDRLYTPGLTEEEQCTGYKELKKMVVNNITPASMEEMQRWKNDPTMEELFSVPDIKYLRFLHPLLRVSIIENWEQIKQLKID